MSTFLIRYAAFQSSSYPIVIQRLGWPGSRSNPHLKFWKCRESNPTGWLLDQLGDWTFKYTLRKEHSAMWENIIFLLPFMSCLKEWVDEIPSLFYFATSHFPLSFLCPFQFGVSIWLWVFLLVVSPPFSCSILLGSCGPHQMSYSLFWLSLCEPNKKAKRCFLNILLIR